MANIKEFNMNSAIILSSIVDDNNETEVIFIEEIISTKYMSMTDMKEHHHLKENNWANWSRHMTPILKVCKV